MSRRLKLTVRERDALCDALVDYTANRRQAAPDRFERHIVPTVERILAARQAPRKVTLMPTVNIPVPLRFGLYLLASLGSIVVIYAIEKGWAGDAEQQLWTGFAGLLTLLAASKTPLHSDRDQRGDVGVLEAALVVLVIVVIILLLA